MDERRLLALRVLQEGWPVAEASRAAGVSRQTGHRWVARAGGEGIASLAERSRRPLRSPFRTSEQLEAEVLALKERFPWFGGRKLAVLAQGRLSARTAARILARHGISCPKAPREPMLRFERQFCNELWQMDFKGMPRRRRVYEPLCILDDASRFAIALPALQSQRLEHVWEALWGAFQTYGLPEAILTDNGPSFRCNATWRPSSLDLRLMLLGVRSIHGRPYHPQTQGKVERFHGTLAGVLGDALWQPTLGQGTHVLARFRDFYNWERPHEALAQRVPGALYQPSSRPCPERLPEPCFPEGSAIRRVNQQGLMGFKGRTYRMGKALIAQPVALLQEQDGVCVYYHDRRIGQLDEFEKP
jgi:transposase InsO family protein